MKKNNQIYYQICNQTFKTIIKSQFKKTISALVLLVLMLPLYILPATIVNAGEGPKSDYMEKDTNNTEIGNNVAEENQNPKGRINDDTENEWQLAESSDANQEITSLEEHSIVATSSQIPKVGDVVKGTVRIGSYWMVGEMSYFNVSNFTGDLRGGYAPNPLECLDYTAANPTNVTATYEATVTRVRLSSGYVDYNVVITPPGVTTGERDQNGRLLGYQRVGGTIRVDRDFTGSVVINKSSGNPSISDDNMAYTLEDAVYGLYNSSDNLVTTIKTDERGRGRANNIVTGNYYLKEITPPIGYAIDVKTYNVSVEVGGTTTIAVEDMPIHNPINLIIEKIDSETESNSPQGAASLEGAEFTIRYYDDYYDEDPMDLDIEPNKTWVLQTDEYGLIYLEELYFVSGDDFYYNLEGETTIPLGTITIEETKAPLGYLANEEVIVHQITTDGYDEEISILTTQVIEECIIRGDVEIIKYTNDEKGDKKPLEGIEFTFVSKTTGDEFTIVTDKDGFATTKELEISERGNLVFDTYTITEHNPNPDYEVIPPFEVTISKEGEVIYFEVENQLIEKPNTEKPNTEKPNTEKPNTEKKGAVIVSPKTGNAGAANLTVIVFIASLMTVSVIVGAKFCRGMN